MTPWVDVKGAVRYYGGGIYSSGDLNMEYTTVVNNAAEAAGGGLYNTGNIALANNLFERQRLDRRRERLCRSS